MPRRSLKRKRGGGTDYQSAGMVGALGALFVGHFLALILLADQSPLVHWLVAGVSGLAGFVGGRVWYALWNRPAKLMGRRDGGSM